MSVSRYLQTDCSKTYYFTYLASLILKRSSILLSVKPVNGSSVNLVVKFQNEVGTSP